MAGWFKTQKRRLEQGILEGLGAASSSKDESFERDDARFKRLEESLLRLNASVLGYVSAVKRHGELSNDIILSLEALGASDMRYGVTARTAEAISRAEGLNSLLRVHNGLKTTVLRTVEQLVLDRITTPVGVLLKQIPVVKRLLDTRRQCLTDYDAYKRKAENARNQDSTSATEQAKADAKVKAAAAALAAAKEQVSAALTRLEEQRAALQRDAAHAMVAAQVHLAAHCSDALAPTLPLFPQCASTMAELAGQVAHLAAVSARPAGLQSPSSSSASRRIAGSSSSGELGPGPSAAAAPPAGFASLAAAASLPKGAAMPPGLKLSTSDPAASFAASAAVPADDGAPAAAVVASSLAASSAVVEERVLSEGDDALLTAAVQASFAALHAAAGASGRQRSYISVAPTLSSNSPVKGANGIITTSPPSISPTGRPSLYARATKPSIIKSQPPTSGGSTSGGGKKQKVGVISSNAAAAAAATGLEGVHHYHDSDDDGGEEGEGIEGVDDNERQDDDASDDDDVSLATASRANSPAQASSGPKKISAPASSVSAIGTSNSGRFGADTPTSPVVLQSASQTPVVASASTGGAAAAAGRALSSTAASVSNNATAITSNRANTTNMIVARVQYDFSPENPDELRLAKGQLLLVEEQGEDGWWLGRVVASSDASPAAVGAITASSGLFPYNYVTLIKPGEEGHARAVAAAAAAVLDGTAPSPPFSSVAAAAAAAAAAPPIIGGDRSSSSSAVAAYSPDRVGMVAVAAAAATAPTAGLDRDAYPSSLMSDLAYVSATVGAASWTEAEAEAVARLRLEPSPVGIGGPSPRKAFVAAMGGVGSLSPVVAPAMVGRGTAAGAAATGGAGRILFAEGADETADGGVGSQASSSDGFAPEPPLRAGSLSRSLQLGPGGSGGGGGSGPPLGLHHGSAS